MNHTPFPIRVAAVPIRLLGYIARAVLAWFGADPAATAVFSVVFAGVLVAFVTLPPLNRWIGARVATYWQRHRSERMWRELDQLDGERPADVHDGHTRILPGVTELGPATPPPVRRALMRRRIPGVHIPRRRVRHTTTSTDRRH